jgi:diguanylate cyclase (GGDEF)-like protein
MRTAILNFLNSGHFFCTDEEETKHKFLFLNSVISFTILITFLMGIYRYLHANGIVSFFDFSFSFLSVLLLFLLRKRKDMIELVATILLVAAFMLFVTVFVFATMQSTRIAVFFLLVASAFYLKGVKEGNYWLLAVMGVIGIIHFGGFVGTGYTNLDIFAIYIYLLSFYIILRLYEAVKMTHTKRLIDLNANLEHLVKQRTEELLHEKELLKVASTTDQLTQLFNRYRMDQVFNEASDKLNSDGRPFCIILIDVDHFKRINDLHGHNVGDMFLKAIADILRASFREGDTVGRWGGEEFLIFLPHTRLREAQTMGERLRKTIAQHPFSHLGHQSISLGIAAMQHGETLKSLIHRADKALYTAKKTGRNRVVSWDELSQTAQEADRVIS